MKLSKLNKMIKNLRPALMDFLLVIIKGRLLIIFLWVMMRGSDLVSRKNDQAIDAGISVFTSGRGVKKTAVERLSH